MWSEHLRSSPAVIQQHSNTETRKNQKLIRTWFRFMTFRAWNQLNDCLPSNLRECIDTSIVSVWWYVMTSFCFNQYVMFNLLVHNGVYIYKYIRVYTNKSQRAWVETSGLKHHKKCVKLLQDTRIEWWHSIMMTQSYHRRQRKSATSSAKHWRFASLAVSGTVEHCQQKVLISLRNEWEVVRTECDALGEGTTNCQHGQSSILKLLHLHALHALSRGRSKTS